MLYPGEADHATDFAFLSKELEIVNDVSGNPILTLDAPRVLSAAVLHTVYVCAAD